ncbi:hypothetical protein BU23DRAFT_45213 [Bimuria novae-zelandiae CBS 107.79]|uniref:Uncharacterized protein n=1 Tax=Bimuria novae-zelandiae CBS 107.79 TaxID=1447943 RepID=A0A6A5VSU3_9PLEO|nr:hypothetical protein BU23DRAFT_45213 [Bimuria novae-zelandiae CBS 107.79]
MSILRKTSITVTHTPSTMGPPSPSFSSASQPPTWDVTYSIKTPITSVADWVPTKWTRTPLQKLKFLKAQRQKADAILRAARTLAGKIEQGVLIRETDNVGREAKMHYADKLGLKGFRLHAVKREGRWEARVWEGKEEPIREGIVAKGETLEACLGALQCALREKGLPGLDTQPVHRERHRDSLRHNNSVDNIRK